MTQYQIQIHGHLDQQWEAMFPDFSFSHEMTPENQPITLMTGKVVDQSALYGTINRLQNMGVELLSFQSQKDDDLEK